VKWAFFLYRLHQIFRSETRASRAATGPPTRQTPRASRDLADRPEQVGRVMEKQMTKTPKLLAAILAGTLAFGAAGSAMAAKYQQGYQSSFNTIKSVSGDTVTLIDNTSYVAPYGFAMSRLKAGDRVQITWLNQDGTRTATGIVLG
jgi:hypothetical protein